jgi:hypothetical protein
MIWVELKYMFEKHREKHAAMNAALRVWAHDFDFLDLPLELQNVPSAAVALAASLDTLHEQWGDTLCEKPSQIWNDVTAFTKSPFFVTTKAITIKTLVRVDTGRHECSAAPLCRISRDHTGTKLVAVLTIWPSQ